MAHHPAQPDSHAERVPPVAPAGKGGNQQKDKPSPYQDQPRPPGFGEELHPVVVSVVEDLVKEVFLEARVNRLKRSQPPSGQGKSLPHLIGIADKLHPILVARFEILKTVHHPVDPHVAHIDGYHRKQQNHYIGAPLPQEAGQHHSHHEDQGAQQGEYPPSRGGGQDGGHHQSHTQEDDHSSGTGGPSPTTPVLFFSQGPDVADPQADQHGKKRREVVPVDKGSRGNIGVGTLFPPQDVGRSGSGLNQGVKTHQRAQDEQAGDEHMNPASPLKTIKGQPVKKEESDPENQAVQGNIRIKRDWKWPLPSCHPRGLPSGPGVGG